MINLAILISGRGSNMKAILNFAATKKIINPTVVISNNYDAAGIKIASKFGIDTIIIPNIKDRRIYDKKLEKTLLKYKITPKNGLICLAGFMRVLGADLTKKYKNRIMNIHPSLLPAFAGLNAQKQAIEYGAKYSGCTIHFVDSGIDTGPIILQAIVKIKDNDNHISLAKKILRKEHQLYTKAINLFATKKLIIDGKIVKIINQV